MAKALSCGDEDLLQELLIEICHIVGRFERVTDGLVRIRLVRRRLMYWRGSGVSLDNGASTRRQDTHRVGGDHRNCIEGRLIDPESEALFRVAYEQMLTSLRPLERAYWLARINGMTWRDIEEKGIADRNLQPEIKTRIREAFRHYFGH